MIEITKSLEWDMGHRVPGHKNKCANPHGHRYRLEVTVAGELDQTSGSPTEGMVLDFGDLKELIRTKIHNPLDHGFMIFDYDKSMLDMFEASKENFKVVEVPFIPTAENIAKWCFDQLSPELPSGVVITRCRLYETPNSYADYRPISI